jgi:sortase A
MDLPRKLGVSLVVIGALLLAVFLVPQVYGAALSHLAVAQFRAGSATNSLWDSARIRAYHASLTHTFAPPEAILRVPRLGIEVPVLEGTSDLILNRGVGHIPGTALPGEPGNLAITGHRDGFFRPLKDVATGDRIDVQRPTHIDHYVVRATRIVSPSDTSVLGGSAGASTLTLVTCYPFYFIGAAPQRFIVQADLLPESSPANPPIQSTSGD